MKEISWDDYYERFYDWASTTQKNRSYNLTGYGPAKEVFEIAPEFAYDDEKFATRFIRKAMDAGVHFTPEQVLEFALYADKATLGRMALEASPSFTEDQLEEICMLIEDDDFERLSEKAGIDIFEDPEDDWEDEDDYEEPPAKIGFFTKLMAAFGIADLAGRADRSRHSGRCSGDCAHCPPHYGYRYGRWYFGHGHQYGCEFGGNKGDGSI